MIRSSQRILVLLLVIASLIWDANAQIEIRRIPHGSLQSQSNSNARTLAFGDTLSLPFWDDFSFSGPDPDSTLWDMTESRGVYVNATLGNLPPSLGVASFDGVDASGLPYNTVAPTVGITDVLCSKPIDLAAVPEEPVNKRGTVIFSFYWQMRGNAESPETKDLLRLEFKDSTGVWHMKDEFAGIPENILDVFTFKDYKVEEQYFYKGFQFRFVTEGNTAGPFDGWHIDYVHLNQDREKNVEYHSDRTVTSLPSSIFKNYSMIPHDIFFDFDENEIFPIIQVQTTTRIDSTNNVFYEYHLTDYYTLANGQVKFDTLYSFVSGGARVFVFGEHRYYDIDPLNYSVFNVSDKDSLLLRSEYILTVNDGLFVKSIDDGVITYLEDEFYNYRLNDTVRRYHEIHNTLAYDDGIAEYAASLNSNGGQLAVLFDIPSQDTLTHVDIYFPNFKPLESSETSINISILKDLSGEESAVLTSLQANRQDAFALNQFTRFEFAIPAIVSGEFYVVFQQNTEEFIGIGLDKSTPLGTELIQYNIGNGWEPNIKIEGMLMIRPIFNDSDFVVSSVGGKVPKEVIVYPNPASQQFQIRGEFEKYELYNLSGALELSGMQKEVNISNLKSGIYFLKIYLPTGMESHKLVVR